MSNHNTKKRPLQSTSILNTNNHNPPRKKRKLTCNHTSERIYPSPRTDKPAPSNTGKDAQIAYRLQMEEYENDEDECFDDNQEDDWDDWGELTYDQPVLNIKPLEPEEVLKRALEKRRIANASKDKFWECGKCEFLNHPSNAQCLSCNMPEMDIIRYALNCTDPLQQCDRCYSFIIPTQYEDHLLDCNPILIHKQARSCIKNQWHCPLTTAEKNAICHVTNSAFTKSEAKGQSNRLLETIKRINIKSELLFGGKEEQQSILNHVLSFLEWKVPITIRVHCRKLIPKLMEDTHYRNLFETGYGSGNNDQNVRKGAESKMFGSVYADAQSPERPKYGCLNINLKDEGCVLAKGYGDGYFVMNDTTVRWRVTMTIKDSFKVNGNCGTLKHCKHLLNELDSEELKEIMYVAIHGRCDDKSKQKAYREIQIHGKIELNRDIYSLNVPHNTKNIQLHKTYEAFCEKNGIKLVWF
eukprot:19240_1